MVDPSNTGRRWVCVDGRDDIGEIIDEGKNIGSFKSSMYCVGVHFPATGEVSYYDAGRVYDVTSDANSR